MRRRLTNAEGGSMENHYCSTCIGTTKFAPTKSTVTLEGITYRVFYCNNCMHELYVQIGGPKLAQDAR